MADTGPVAEQEAPARRSRTIPPPAEEYRPNAILRWLYNRFFRHIHVDDHWRDPARVTAWFAGFGLDNVRHRLSTTQDFAGSPEHAALGGIDLLFVDGYHTAEQARFDYEAFRDRLSPRAVVLFHDSLRDGESPVYGDDRKYAVTVRALMDEYRRDPALQVLDLPFGSGLTLLRRPPPGVGRATPRPAGARSWSWARTPSRAPATRSRTSAPRRPSWTRATRAGGIRA